eukprot:1847707-Prymnesium_polylepis.2
MIVSPLHPSCWHSSARGPRAVLGAAYPTLLITHPSQNVVVEAATWAWLTPRPCATRVSLSRFAELCAACLSPSEGCRVNFNTG